MPEVLGLFAGVHRGGVYTNAINVEFNGTYGGICVGLRGTCRNNYVSAMPLSTFDNCWRSN